MKKNKRRLAAAFLLLAVMLYITGIAAALCEPEDAGQEEKDPYDWSDYEGEVILDDPEFFIFDEETLDENKSDSDESPDTGSAEQPETEKDEETDGEGTSGEMETPSVTSGEEPAATNTPAEEPEQPAPVDLKDLFLVEIKVPAGWFNLPEKAVRVKITPRSEALWSKVLILIHI